jgi:hypothetical protein
MTDSSLGENSKLTVLASERDRIQRFFGDALDRQPGRKKNVRCRTPQTS